MKRQHDNKHLDFIRQLPCIICMDNTSTEAAHIRYAEPRAAKPQTGMGIKPDDAFTVPLCSEHHRRQHCNGERTWWSITIGKDPVYIALALWRVTGNVELGEQIVRNSVEHSGARK